MSRWMAGVRHVYSRGVHVTIEDVVRPHPYEIRNTSNMCLKRSRPMYGIEVQENAAVLTLGGSPRG